MSRANPGSRPVTHWSTALCSESTGTSSPPPAQAACGHQLAGHDERLLVRQRHPLARPQRGQRGVEPGRPDDRVDHDVHVGMGRGLEQHVGAGRMASAVAARRQAGVGGLPLGDLCLELLDVPPGRERDHAEVLALPPEHRQRAPADRTGRAKHGHPSRRDSSE